MDTARTVKVDCAIYRPLLDTTLTTDDMRKAKQELNEKPDERKKHLERVRKYLSKEKELTTRTDEEFLLRFLRARKFNDERTANLIKDHYRYRAKNPRLFRRPKDMEDILRCNIFSYLPHRDSQGRAIFLMKIGTDLQHKMDLEPLQTFSSEDGIGLTVCGTEYKKNGPSVRKINCLWCTETFSFKEFVGAGNVLSQWVLKNPVTQINGYVGIWDFKDYSFQHFSSSCSPRLMWMLSSLMQDCFPGRFKVAYCVNCPPLADVVWKLFKPLIREKYRKRIVVIGNDMTELHKYIHPSVLPEEYGGELPPSDCTEAVDKLLEIDSEWDREKKYGYRPQSVRCKGEEDDQDRIASNAQEESCIA